MSATVVMAMVWQGLLALLLIIAIAVTVAIVAAGLFALFAPILGSGAAPKGVPRIAFSHRLRYALFFALVGTVVGVLAGNARNAVLGDIVPAVLALVGAFVPALFGKRTDANDQIFLSGLVLSFSVLAGAITGSHFRDYGRNSEEALTYRANLIARCLVQEQRVKQLVFVSTGEEPKAVGMKCEEYPKD